jgi:23S rRNA U2552 (ribose-2'-O)-methylase RlmE/FtsJ
MNPSHEQSSKEKGLESLTPNAIVFEFLLRHEPSFKRLTELREKVIIFHENLRNELNKIHKGWNNPRGDEYFKHQRQRADNAGRKDEYKFYNMMKEIGDELQASTGAFSLASQDAENIKILDLCMAPGGYTASALKNNPLATAFGITLPAEEGGHKVLLQTSRSRILFLDITMLAKEFGVDNPPLTHPDHVKFLTERPFLEHNFNLIFCDGQVLRTHQRAEWRESHEALRLAVSQLILALQRIRKGGTLIMLLHKLEAWHTTELLYLFQQFSSIQVFKPKSKHAIRSSFYLIAKDVQPDTDAAKAAVDLWKRAWWNATFGGESGTGAASLRAEEEYVRTVLDCFGSELIKIGRPIWATQADALSKMDFVK